MVQNTRREFPNLLCAVVMKKAAYFLINYVFSALSGYNDYTPDGNYNLYPVCYKQGFDFNNPTT